MLKPENYCLLAELAERITAIETLVLDLPVRDYEELQTVIGKRMHLRNTLKRLKDKLIDAVTEATEQDNSRSRDENEHQDFRFVAI